ncbi:MAG: putative hemoglobin-like protein [Ilumatobacteraceae bacterium]|nr:putative hemoglobin-like protein [Ilumatobacteraceae bacterium]
MPDESAPTFYDAVGGMAFFAELVDTFYAGVAEDDVLAPLYPEYPDFTGARHRLTLFLAQYWGGPTTYDDERGHPRLRMRHFPFPVGPLQRDRWLLHMAHAVRASNADATAQQTLLDYFVPAAEHLRNDTGLPITSASYPRS